MGGIGSGRIGECAGQCENCDRVDLSYLTRKKLLNVGRAGMMRWTYAGRTTGAVAIELLEGEAQVRLDCVTIGWDGAKHHSTAVVNFWRSEQHLGGTRRWFLCPACARACRVLYGLARFRCRKCARAIYAVQSAPRHRRPLVQAQKLRMRLGGSGNIMEPLPVKPRTMHWKRYFKMEQRYSRLVGHATAHSSKAVERLLARAGLR